jgi:hypothetical protein
MTKPAGNSPGRLNVRRQRMPQHRFFLVLIVVIGPFKVKIILKRR